MTSFKKLAFTLAVLMTFSSFASNQITLNLQLKGQDYYTVNGDKLTGDHSRIQGSFNISGIIDGQRLNVGQAIPSTQAPNNTIVEILDKKAVRIIEREHGISGVAKANVKKSWGKLKGLSITEEEYLSVMGPVMEQSGIDLLRQLQIQSDDASIESSIELSDINCEKVADLMRCDSEFELIIKISDR